MNLNRTINLNKKFIVLLFLVNIIALCLYYSYALFQVTVIQNNAVVLSTGTVDLTFSTNLTNNSFSLYNGNEITVNITLNSTNASAIGYKLYYTSSTGKESLQVSSATEFDNYVVEGTMTSSKTFSLTFKNNGSYSIITLGAIGGVAGAPIELESGQHEIRLTKVVSDSCYTATVDTSTNEAMITNYSADRCGTTANIPSAISGYTVTSIGNNSLENLGLTSVTIPNSVKTIGSSAFVYNNITSMTIPDSVETIGDSAFAGNEMTRLTLGNSVKTIGDFAFSVGWGDRRNLLTSVTIPDSVITIGDSAFADNKLTSVTLGNSVETIGNNAFSEDSGYNFFVVDSETGELIGNQITSITIPDSVVSIGDSAFAYNAITTVVIGNGVTNIGSDAFRENLISNLTLGNSVETISSWAFYGNRLTSFTLPISIGYIADGAFDCNSILT